MDTLGLLAAWVGVVSFLATLVIAGAAHILAPGLQRWWATTSPVRARKRIGILYDGMATAELPDNGYLADLVALYGAMLVNLVAAGTLVVVSIEILDLGPALLASTLPFSIDAKLLTRLTGMFLLAVAYGFVFRLTSLAMRIHNKTLPRKAGYTRIANEEIAALRRKYGVGVKQAAGAGTRE